MKSKKNSKLDEWQERNKGVEQECPRCHKMRELSVDHIIPVNIMEQLGLREQLLNDEENFENLCFLCNRFKGGRIDMAHSKTIPLLKKYVNLL